MYQNRNAESLLVEEHLDEQAQRDDLSSRSSAHVQGSLETAHGEQEEEERG